MGEAYLEEVGWTVRCPRPPLGQRGLLVLWDPHPVQTSPPLCPRRFRSIHCRLYPDTPWCPRTAVF